MLLIVAVVGPFFIIGMTFLTLVLEAIGLRRLPSAKRVIVVSGIWILFVMLGCWLPASVPVWINDYRLYRFADNLYQYPLPPNTVVLSREAEIKLMGNGNHCDFFVYQTMVTDLSLDEIDDYYDGLELPQAYADNKGNLLVSVHDLRSLPDGRLQFTLRLYDFGNPENGDWRCT